MALIDIDRRSVLSLGDSDRGETFYDRRLTGFGLRVSSTGKVSYFVEYRPGAGGRGVAKRRIVIGRESPTFRADQARHNAEQELARVKLGDDPGKKRNDARESPTVSQIMTRYLEDRIERLRRSRTAVHVRGYDRLYICPEIGSRKCSSLDRTDILRLHRKIGQNYPITANRVVETLRAAFTYAQKQGLLPAEFINPAAAFEPYPETARERFLSDAEFARLGESLRVAETAGLPWDLNAGKKLKHCPKEAHRQTKIDPFAIAAIRLLLLTGARLREILNLKWDDVDLERGIAVLQTSKTGRKPLVLGSAALTVINSIPKTGRYVIAGKTTYDARGQLIERPRSDLHRPWRRLRKHAQLDDLRLHDLRHTFASVGASSGVGLYVLGQLLNHSAPATTKRYAHLADTPLRRASNEISQLVADSLVPRTSSVAGNAN